MGSATLFNNIDEYYYIAEDLLEEEVFSFIYHGTRKYFDQIIETEQKMNITQKDKESVFNILLSNTNDFYETYLKSNKKFNDLPNIEQSEIMYEFLRKELPNWIYDETDYTQDEAIDQEYNDGIGDAPYDITKIDIVSNTYQAEYLLKKFKLGELQLSPDYQRNFVWTSKQKSRLIESILIKIPLPIFYIDARNEDKWIVIDGLQRITTIFTYMEDEFKLSSMEYLTQLNGKKFSKLERKYQRRIEDFQMLCNFIRPNTPSNIAFNIFQRINTLGTQLEVQEIRNAMYIGQSTDLLKELSKSDEFKNIVDKSLVTKNKINPLSKRMEDHAIILRYLSFKITSYLEYNNNDMNKFLSSAMEKINKMNAFEIASLKNTFLECMNKAFLLFEDHGFRKPSKNKDKVNPISKTLFEVICYSLDKYSENEITKHKDALIGQLNNLFLDKEFTFKTSIATNNPPNVKYRFEKIEETFTKVIGY